MFSSPYFSPGLLLITQVFDAISQECAKQQIYVHLDNHVSKAGWCCAGNDGNAWFGDTSFDVKKWTRALGYMAEHVSIGNKYEGHKHGHDRLMSIHRANFGRPSKACRFAMNSEALRNGCGTVNGSIGTRGMAI